MPSLVWCPPGWCCGKLYLVPDTRTWRCPYSGVPLRQAHTVVADFDGLGWSKPAAMRRFFTRWPESLGLLAGPDGHAVLGPDAQAAGSKQRRLCDLLRCVVGDPFRPLPPAPAALLAWRDGTAAKLAARIDQERDFSPEGMGILADALEEASLDDAGVVAHLREPGPHARGCHVIDWLLDRL